MIQLAAFLTLHQQYREDDLHEAAEERNQFAGLSARGTVSRRMVNGRLRDSDMLLRRRAIVLCKPFFDNIPIRVAIMTRCSRLNADTIKTSPRPRNTQPTQGPSLRGRFICHCHDCRKITASMFATHFSISDAHLVHERGREQLRTDSQSETIANSRTMTNYFCGRCGTLMYRVGSGWPGYSILRLGTVDHFSLHETKLRPVVEQFVSCRGGWLQDPAGGQGAVEDAEGTIEQAERQFKGFEKSAVNPPQPSSTRVARVKSSL